MNEDPNHPAVERIQLRDGFSLPRIIKGAWQLASDHNEASRGGAIEDMFAYADAGFNAFDCGDVYTGVEELIGRFMQERRRRLGSADDVCVLTKYIPDLQDLERISRHDVERAVDRSIQRLRVERLGALQLAWWAFTSDRYLDVLRWLSEIQNEGKIHALSLVNFSTAATLRAAEAGFDIITCQQQYSILDSRPEKGFVDVCLAKGIRLLTYGTLAGGFISRKWLGAREPVEPFENRSLRKYKLIIDEIGGWALFQEILGVLDAIAQKHDVSIANVATRYVLERPAVAAVIIGARDREHIGDNRRVFGFRLSREDNEMLECVLRQRRELSGDVWELEREIDGKHGRVMKRDLHARLGDGA